MLFKNELPPPRYTFDGDINDNDLTVETSYDLKSNLPDLAGSELLLLAPRCASLAASFGGSAIGTIQLLSSTKPKESTNALASAALDFYEVDARSEDFMSSQQWTVPVRKGPNNLVILTLPALGESEASYLGHKLIPLLNPAKIVLVTPGTSFMDSPVSYISTQNFDTSNISAPRAEPPVIVQGVGAAAVSRAQLLGIPALALVVSADGPSNHEIVSDMGMNDLRTALFSLLNLKLVSEPQIERNMSVLYF